jgi:CheY-specific phosphatase CheX
VEAESVATLDEIVESACLALFDSVGTPLVRADAGSHSRDDIGASIGFTGRMVRGALVLVSTRRLVEMALPQEIRAGVTDSHVADWMGELANQLLGRIKNKLVSHGVVLDMSTPTVMFGLEIARKDRRSGLRRYFEFRHDDQPLRVVLDAEVTDEFERCLSLKPTEAGLPEGELALF